MAIKLEIIADEEKFCMAADTYIQLGEKLGVECDESFKSLKDAVKPAKIRLVKTITDSVQSGAIFVKTLYRLQD
jgi:hypothetical protein